MKFSEWNKEHKIEAEFAPSDVNPYMSDRPMIHYAVTLRFDGRTMKTWFSHGSMWSGELNAETILECLATDALYEGLDFDEFCRDLGYNGEETEARRVYNGVARNTKKLRKLLSDDGLFDELLYNIDW